MSENRKGRFIRAITKSIFGGLAGGFAFYLAILFFKIAINTVAGGSVIPDGTELGGFALGFGGAIAYELSKLE